MLHHILCLASQIQKDFLIQIMVDIRKPAAQCIAGYAVYQKGICRVKFAVRVNISGVMLQLLGLSFQQLPVRVRQTMHALRSRGRCSVR